MVYGAQAVGRIVQWKERLHQIVKDSRFESWFRPPSKTAASEANGLGSIPNDAAFESPA